MSINQSIFRAYDIRGIYPDEINEEIVFKISAALVKFLNPDKLVVASDNRASSKPLKETAIEAITASGVDVIDIGQTNSPLFYFAVNKLNAAGGIIITASHNPLNYNGLKLVRERAIAIGKQNGLGQIKRLAQDISINTIRRGESSRRDLTREYDQFLLEKARFKKEPQAEGLKFEFDSDSDRLTVYEKNKKIRADLLSGVIIKDFLEKSSFFDKISGGPKFVYDLRFSKAIPEYIEQSGGKTIRSRIGHPFIKEMMRKNKAVFGAELSGHFYFKDVFYVEAPVLMKLKLLKIINETGKSISELVKPFEKYFHSGEMSVETESREQSARVIQKLKENYKDGKSDDLDGITIEYSDWWFNLRPSNTEPVIRLVVEAKTQYIMEQKKREISEVVRQFFA